MFHAHKRIAKPQSLGWATAIVLHNQREEETAPKPTYSIADENVKVHPNSRSLRNGYRSGMVHRSWRHIS